MFDIMPDNKNSQVENVTTQFQEFSYQLAKLQAYYSERLINKR